MGREMEDTLGVVDLGSLGMNEAEDDAVEALRQAIYANDAQVSIDGSGIVTIQFAFRNNRGISQAQPVSIPYPLYMELVGLAPDIHKEMQRRAAKQMSQARVGGLEAARAARDQSPNGGEAA